MYEVTCTTGMTFQNEFLQPIQGGNILKPTHSNIFEIHIYFCDLPKYIYPDNYFSYFISSRSIRIINDSSLSEIKKNTIRVFATFI